MGLELPLRVLWSRRSLDAMLAAGFDPASDPALSRRAAQLVSRRHRDRMAGALEHLVRVSDADRKPGASATVPLAREGIAEAREPVLALAGVLRNADQVEPRGMAMVEELLVEARSVLYRDVGREAVEREIRRVLDGLGADPVLKEENPRDARALSAT